MTPNSQDNRVTRTRELYDQCRFGHFCYGRKREEYNRPLVEFLESLDPRIDLYDVGCGTGYWLDVARRCGIAQERTCGVDLSAASLAAARARGFRVICSDVLNLALDADVSDVTVSNGVIHHTPDPERAFAELVRVTKPGGRIFLAVYSRWNISLYLFHRLLWPVRWLYWNRNRNVLDWIWPLAKLAFQPLARRYLGADLDDATGKTMLLDQVMAPCAHMFSRAKVRRYAARHNCRLDRIAYTKGRIMLAAVLTVAKPGPDI